MRINDNNSISSYKYSVGVNSVELTVKAHNTESVTYAVYLLSTDGKVIERKWYQADGNFVFTNILAGNYKFRIYIQRGDEKSSFLSTGLTIAQYSRELDDILAGVNVQEDLSEVLLKAMCFFQPSFGKVRSAIHGSIQISDRTRRELCPEALGLCRPGDLLSHQFKFLMDCIPYVADVDFL